MASLIIVSWFEDVELHFSHFLCLFSMFSRSWCWFFQFPAAVHFMSSCQLHCSLCLVRGGICRQTLLLTLQLCMTWNLASPTTVPTSCQPFSTSQSMCTKSDIRAITPTRNTTPACLPSNLKHNGTYSFCKIGWDGRECPQTNLLKTKCTYQIAQVTHSSMQRVTVFQLYISDSPSYLFEQMQTNLNWHEKGYASTGHKKNILRCSPKNAEYVNKEERHVHFF